MADPIKIMGGIALGGLVAYFGYSYLMQLTRSTSFTENDVTWTYEEKNTFFPNRRSSCAVSLNSGNLVTRLVDQKCDGKVDHYSLINNAKDGTKISEVYAWRAEPTEAEFLGHDEFFGIAKETIKERGK